MPTIGQKLREWAGMSTEEDIKQTGRGNQENTGKRGKGINEALCRQGNPEYCSDRQNGEIQNAVEGANSRKKAGSK